MLVGGITTLLYLEGYRPMAASDQEQSPGPEQEKDNLSAPSASGSKKGESEPTATNKAEGEDSSLIQPELHQHHVSRLLDEVLEEPTQTGRRFKHPMILDLALAIGLLSALGGFTIGLFKMYLTHSAEQSITQRNYKAAIAILKGAPLPGFFTIAGSDPEELLSQALYLDAMEKFVMENDVDEALRELQQIRPGSRYFNLAQELIDEKAEPSPTFLQGGTQQIETSPEVPQQKKPILPELPQEGSQ